jgi:hypothetical protein
MRRKSDFGLTIAPPTFQHHLQHKAQRQRWHGKPEQLIFLCSFAGLS